MTEPEHGIKERIQHGLILESVAKRLDIQPEIRATLSHVGMMTESLVDRDLIWDDVPERCDTKDFLASGLTNRIALAIFRRKDSFKMFEVALNDPEQRQAMLEAYSRCWRYNHSVTALEPSQVFEALHSHRPTAQNATTAK